MIRLLLDSGIFSSWQRGETLPIKDYIAYIKDLKPYFSSYVSMDSIPGKAGTKRTNDQVAKSAELSYKNQQIMKDAGLTPIPVFHQGESFSWLERYLKDGELHIGISSAKDLSHPENAKWLDEVFTLLTNKDGSPIVRTHGFGITKPAFLSRYPFATVDSTTWSLSAGYGIVFIPTMGHDGKPNWLRPMLVHISDVNQFRQGNKSFSRMGPLMQQWVIKCLQAAGVTLSEAMYFSNSRRRVALYYFLQLASIVKDTKFLHRHKAHSIAKTIKIDQLHIIFSTAIGNKEFSNLLNSTGANDRLLSYYEIKKRPREQLIEYVTNGSVKLRGVKANSSRDFDSETYRNRRRRSILARNAQSTPPWE